MPKNFQEFEEYRKNWELGENRLMREDEIAMFDSFFANTAEAKKYQNEGFTRALVGDFSQFESVEPMMKGYLGAKKCYELYQRFGNNPENPQLHQEIKDRLMEADLRAGFALGGKNTADPFGKFLKDCERIANRQMLIQTLEEPEPTAKLRLRNQFEREDSATANQKMATALNNDLEQRVEMAKILFMSHLGKFQTYDDQGQPMETSENIAEAYTHGGRTMFILPAGANQKPVMDGIQGAHPEQSGLESRSFATHGITPRTLRKDGSIASEATEYRAKALGAYAPRLHKGMNASVGGLGQIGPNGKVITADGTNGHMYMHLVEGKENVCGTMLVGFENASPGQKGRMGHAHGASAKKAGSSAFLSDKSYLGAELGGRVVDLSGLSGEKLGSLLTEFENGYRRAAQAAQSGNPGLLDACNDLLTGKQMSVGQIKGLLNELKVTPAQINSVEQARAGHLSDPKYTPIAETPPVPLKVAASTEKKPFRVTQCAGLVRPEPPKVMKKPSRFDKLMYHLSFHSKRSYVSRYNEYQRTLSAEMAAYNERMEAYYSTLAALERNEGPETLQAAYHQAVAQAEAMFNPPVNAPTAQTQQAAVHTEVKTASPEMTEKLENALLDNLFEGMPQDQGPTEKKEALRNKFLGHIRETDSYRKLIEAGDSQISSVLEDPEKMKNAFQGVSKGILKIVTQNETRTAAPQKNQMPTVAPVVKSGENKTLSKGN